MTAPTLAPCAPWIDEADLMPPCSNDYDLPRFEEAAMAASGLLWRLSGRQYPGVCTATVRPCAKPRTMGNSGEWPAGLSLGTSSWPGWATTLPPGWIGGWGSCDCDRSSQCGCLSLSQVELPGPVDTIGSVKVDGVTLTAGTDYRVDDNRFLVRLGGARWPCFPAGTLVLTDSGLKPIERIAAGERVLTHRNRWRKVTRAGKTGESETVRMAGRGGVVRCTPDHQFWASEVFAKNPGGDSLGYARKLGVPGWVTADRMVGQAWAMPRTYEELPMSLPAGLTLEPEDFWWFVGRWIGDGWTEVGNHRVGLCCSHAEADDLAARLAKSGWLWRRREERTVTKFRVSNTSTWDWLRETFGTRAHNKRLPAWLLGAPREIRQSFLDGYVSADGWRACPPGKQTPFTSVRTVSRELALGLRLLVASLGYAPMSYEGRQTTTHIEGRSVASHTPYRVDWPDTKPGGAFSQAWTDDEHLWGRVRSVDLDEEVVPVFDLEVEEDHSFVAEGFVVHNCCQDLSKAATEPGTFQVTYDYGLAPPPEGVVAAAELTCELLHAMLPDLAGKDCRLPRKVVNVVRQGVSMAIVDISQFLQSGRTGLYWCDLFIGAHNPHGNQEPASVYSPDLPRAPRRVGT